MSIARSSKRACLMIGCGSAALALGLTLGASPAAAQGVQATPDVVSGTAFLPSAPPNETRVEVVSPTAVIDWTPFEDASGNALDFLPVGSTLSFTSAQLPDFAVLNRILPATNGNIARIDGSVISRVAGAAGPVPGGFVAFYSPTGILIGGTASFDVGRLMLTTLDTSPASFELFAQQGFGLQLQGAPGSTARIAIAPGAQILATPENAFFAVVAADVEMRGTARINGSHAYIAAEVVNLSFDNGLFGISVPVGTAAAGEVLTLDGTIGGPSSTGNAGDNHMIYAVARAAADPISMLLRGTIGFDPAQSAGVVNGEIILSANHDVFGRFVDGSSISEGIDARFDGNSALSGARADITIADVTASSSLLAIGTHRVTAGAVASASSFAGNLLLVGRESAALTAANGNGLTVAGGVLVDSRDYGVSGSFLQQIDLINAAGGNALIEASTNGTITLSGEVRVLADAFAGVEDLQRIAGTAQGGTAAISANGGTIDIARGTVISAAGNGTTFQGITTGAQSRGGSAELRARGGGSVSIGGTLDIVAGAIGAQGSLFAPSSVSNAFGGNARIALLDGGGTINVTGTARLIASAFGGSSNVAGAGSLGDAGEATVSIQENGQILIGGALDLDATAAGGANGGGTGGRGLGGRASALTAIGGTIGVTGDFGAFAVGRGGAGRSGGDGLGGIAGANAAIGTITIDGVAAVDASGEGGDAAIGPGGDGGIGRGGKAFLQAVGTLTQTASLTVAGPAFLNAIGTGGRGGDADGQAIAAGRGGDAFGGQFTVPNQADPAFNSGAFVLAGGDNGSITIGGGTFVSANANGGVGGNGAGVFEGGNGGNAFGGFAQVGLALFGLDGSVGQGVADFGDVVVTTDASGGRGGIAGADIATGIGGSGTGGTSLLTVQAGTVTAGDLTVQAFGGGGAGFVAGSGTGGAATVLGSLGGQLAAARITANANGFGGQAEVGTGGTGRGGVAGIVADGIDIAVDDGVLITADGRGGESFDGAGGDGIGGEAFVTTTPQGPRGTITIAAHAAIQAVGTGGNSTTDFAAGNGTGGLAYAEAFGTSILDFGSLQGVAVGRGGTALLHEGGNGTGGTVRLGAFGSGSRLSVARNVPAFIAQESPGGSAFLNADGIGAATTGGNGIGGTGRGGSVIIAAALGGTVNLPVNILADPERAADALQFFARGLGGDSGVDGGSGGAAFGGSVNVLVDGGTLVSGVATLSSMARGGSSLDPALNIAGGAATGGQRSIRVVNNGALTIETDGGGSGAQGGNGSGTGDGGAAIAGSELFEVIGSVANLAGRFRVSASASGGTGRRGGDAGGGGIVVNIDNAAINLATGVGGPGVLDIGGDTLGGAGDIAGGNALGTAVDVTFTQSSLSGGGLDLAQFAAGGTAGAADAAGGAATGALVRFAATGSTLTLTGPLGVIASARGGDGGAAGTGGAGTGGEATVTLTDTNLTVAGGGQAGPGGIAVRADGSGGLAGAIGSGSGGIARLGATGGRITTDDLLVSAQGSAFGASGQVGSTATGGLASLDLAGAAILDAATITITGSAISAAGGSASGGTAEFIVAPGSTASVTAANLFLTGDAFGGDPLTNTAGRFVASVGGGNVNLGNLTATAIGDRVAPDQPPSIIAALGGNLNVTGELTGFTFGSIGVEYASGGIIGSAGTGQTATSVLLDAGGSLVIEGDGGATGGIGGQFIDLLAGRSILLDGNLTASNGGITLTANRGGGQALAQPPVSVITMGQGTRIDGGTGAVSISLLDGAGDPQRANGAITLASISAASIDVRNFGTGAGSDITVLADGVLTASGAGRAIDLASLNGEVINLAGDAGLVLTGGGHYAVFAATPTGSQIGSFANYQRRYNVADAAAYDALNPGGNFAAFRIVPVLTVTANNASRFYGNANPAFTASITGFLPGDGIADLDGAALLTTTATGTSGIGQYGIDAALGTLLSAQGYQFTFAPGVLTVTPRPIIVTADALSRIYGNANPALTFTVGGLGLVNGDQLTGALATTAGPTTGVGTVAITQGSLAANPNYALTFVNGLLTITPRPLTITADSFSRIYGNANPALTFTVGGLGLVNGDQLTGALATGGVTTGVGTVPITLGTLTAGANYAITFNPGTLTITPRPLTVAANNLSKTLGLPDPLLTFLVISGDLVNGDQLSGALVRDAGERIGTFVIRQGTLAAGPNYALTFLPGTLTVNAPPAPPVINNPTLFEPPLVIAGTPPPVAGEEQERFGADFPERPDAPLISEDPLLDDPVASGGDSTLYGDGSSGGAVPPGGGQ